MPRELRCVPGRRVGRRRRQKVRRGYTVCLDAEGCVAIGVRRYGRNQVCPIEVALAVVGGVDLVDRVEPYIE